MFDLLTISTIPLIFLVGLLLVKIVATATTIGSGASGGILAPSLLSGLIFGYVVAMTLPLFGLVALDVVALGLIGMAGVFAGVTHAPITSAALLYEITNEPLVIPIVLISGLAGFLPLNIYILKVSILNTCPSAGLFKSLIRNFKVYDSNNFFF